MAILTPDSTSNWNGVKVKKFLLTEHNPNRIAMPNMKRTKTIGITVHNTDSISVSSSTTMAETYTRATYNGNMKDVRVHFYCDAVETWQNLPLDEINWSCADCSGDGNRKTIAIECIMSSQYNAQDKKSEDNCAKLVAYLLHKYDLNVEDNLFTHTHWLNVRDGKRGTNDYLNISKNSYKNCPAYILPHWDEFKEKVQKYLDKLNGVNTTPAVLYRVRKTWEDAKSQIGAYSSLENAKKACKERYQVFDNDGKVVYTYIKEENTVTSTPVMPTPSAAKKEADIYYRAFANGKWWGEIKNYNTTNSNGYAGVEGKSIKGFAAKSTVGTLKYRVHVKGGTWLSWISGYDINNWKTGCAGNKVREIDAIQFSLENTDEYEVKYRVSTINSKSYLSWIEGFNTKNSMGYAGVFGKAIDKIQVYLIKK